MEEKVINILKSVFEKDNVTSDTSQFNCEEWDSLRYLNIIIELESEFGLSFEPEEIVQMNSVKKIVQIITNKKKQS